MILSGRYILQEASEDGATLGTATDTQSYEGWLEMAGLKGLSNKNQPPATPTPMQLLSADLIPHPLVQDQEQGPPRDAGVCTRAGGKTVARATQHH